jgi:iron(III) transport system substrate-binding protein
MNRNKNLLRTLAAMTALSFAATACGGGAEEPASSGSDTTPTTGTAEGVSLTEGGCISPDDPLVEAAREEGEVVMSGPPDPTVRKELPAAFEDAYGVQLNYVGGRGSEISAKLKSERAAGIYSQDVFVGGGDTMANTYHASGWLVPLSEVIPEETLSGTDWVRGDVPWVDAEESILKLSEYVAMPYVINTEKVDEDEVPTYKELLDPRFKGEIIIGDPTTSGGGANDVGMFMAADGYGEEFVKDLYLGQEPQFTTEDRQAVDALAQGKYSIGQSLNQADVDRAIADGLPLKIVLPEDGMMQVTSGYGLLAVADKAPHPNAAKLLATWLACKDGNAAWNEAYGSLSTRSDVPKPEAAGDYQVVQPGIDYFDTYSWEYLTEGKAAAKAQIKELLGG